MNKIAIIVAVWLGIPLILTVGLSIPFYIALSETFHDINFWDSLIAASVYFFPTGITGAMIQGIMSKANYFGIASFGMASFTVGTLTTFSTYFLTFPLLSFLLIDVGDMAFAIIMIAAPAYICAVISHAITE